MKDDRRTKAAVLALEEAAKAAAQDGFDPKDGQVVLTYMAYALGDLAQAYADLLNSIENAPTSYTPPKGLN